MTSSERATQIWPVLALAARNRQVLTYEILGQLIGVPRQGLGHLLEPIQSYCLLHDLPPLSALIVSSKTGFPSPGVVAADAVPAAQISMFNFDWNEIRCPMPEAFASAVTKLPSNGRPEAVRG